MHKLEVKDLSGKASRRRPVYSIYQGEIKARVISLKSIPQPLHK